MPPRTSLDRSAAVIGLITVAIANLLYLSGLRAILDPMLSMDPFYIRMAQQPVATILGGNSAWGPLYAVWLKPMVAMFGDPIAVYTANVYALSLGVSIAIYFHVLLLTRRAAPATVAALFFLISDFNVPLSSKVSGFALMVLLVGITAARFASSRPRRLSIATAGVLFASYARPELYPAAWCLCVVALWFGYKESSASGRRALLWPTTSLICILLLILCIGAPTYGSDRFLVAFREHFAWNWSNWHGEGGTFLTIWQRAFGEAHSIARALLNNPIAVAHHLSDNILGTARFMIAAAFGHYPILMPANQETLVMLEDLLLSAGAWGCLIYVAADAGLRRRMYDDYGETLLSYAIIATFSLGSAIVIFPVPHYLAIPGVLLLVAAAVAAAVIVPARSVYSWRWMIAGVLLCLVATPRPFVLPSAYEVPGSRFQGRITVERTVLDTIKVVQSLSLPRPVQVLTATDGIGEMLGDGFNEVKVWQKGARSLQDFMRENDVGVVINLEGGRDSFTVDDPYWELVHTDPAAAGFVRVHVPNHGTVHVYVRSDLIPR